jgi:hypothetical protein
MYLWGAIPVLGHFPEPPFDVLTEVVLVVLPVEYGRCPSSPRNGQDISKRVVSLIIFQGKSSSDVIG